MSAFWAVLFCDSALPFYICVVLYNRVQIISPAIVLRIAFTQELSFTFTAKLNKSFIRKLSPLGIKMAANLHISRGCDAHILQLCNADRAIRDARHNFILKNSYQN